MSDEKKQDDSLYNWVLGIGLIVLLFALVWWIWCDQIKNIVRWVRWAELKLVDLVLPGTVTVSHSRLSGDTTIGRLVAPDGLPSLTPQEMDWNFVSAISEVTGMFYKYPVAIVLILLGAIIIFKAPAGLYKTTYGIDSLIRFQAKAWPIINPIIRFNPTSRPGRSLSDPVPRKLPMFAEALDPLEWLIFNRIKIDETDLDEDAAKLALARQLGRRWRGVRHLPGYMQALFAAFALKGVQKRNESDVLLGEIAKCWDPKGGFHMTGKLKRKVKGILADPKIGGEAAKAAAGHAYVTTAMLRVLAWSR
ncbi:MAG: hypothetical protein U9N14_02545, partial [Pseudomonadota bacterium]|nr:hypothetical protein [Pseudomonadota bacterium]